MKKIRIFLYGETYYDGKRFDNGMIFPISLIMKVPSKVKKRDAFNLFLKQNRDESDIIEEYLKDYKSFNKKMTFKRIQWVTSYNKQWVDGIYDAHEYGKEVRGRARIIQYSNGFKEVEVQCLDKELIVLDGIWEHTDGTKFGNGCGDYFTPFRRME